MHFSACVVGCATSNSNGRVTTTAVSVFFFFQAEDGIRDWSVTGVQTCALPIYRVMARHLLLVAPAIATVGVVVLLDALGRAQGAGIALELEVPVAVGAAHQGRGVELAAAVLAAGRDVADPVADAPVGAGDGRPVVRDQRVVQRELAGADR